MRFILSPNNGDDSEDMCKGSDAFLPHGTQIVTNTGPRLMGPEELIVFELLYQTVVDCFKIATGQWQHFKCMRWHREGAETLARARDYVLGWIESDAMYAYLQLAGYNPKDAVEGLRGLINTKNKTKLANVERMLKEIGRQRDSRRNREDSCE